MVASRLIIKRYSSSVEKICSSIIGHLNRSKIRQLTVPMINLDHIRILLGRIQHLSSITFILPIGFTRFFFSRLFSYIIRDVLFHFSQALEDKKYSVLLFVFIVTHHWVLTSFVTLLLCPNEINRAISTASFSIEVTNNQRCLEQIHRHFRLDPSKSLIRSSIMSMEQQSSPIGEKCLSTTESNCRYLQSIRSRLDNNFQARCSSVFACHPS